MVSLQPTSSKFDIGQTLLWSVLWKRMLIDLKKVIQEWQEAGEQIMLLADMNDDMSRATIQSFYHNLHLIDVIFHAWQV